MENTNVNSQAVNIYGLALRTMSTSDEEVQRFISEKVKRVDTNQNKIDFVEDKEPEGGLINNTTTEEDTDENPIDVICEICFMKFHGQVGYQCHVQIVHEGRLYDT